MNHGWKDSLIKVRGDAFAAFRAMAALARWRRELETANHWIVVSAAQPADGPPIAVQMTL